MEHAEVYFNLLCSVEPSRLKLTGSQESDDAIYKVDIPTLLGHTGKWTWRSLSYKGRIAGAALFGWSRSHFFGPAPTPTLL